uniref:Uncharacterized protein n=1 Tax=Octopus bimaculoides TaxID=37653 RepID=A0A0L8I4G5_OCTBM
MELTQSASSTWSVPLLASACELMMTEPPESKRTHTRSTDYKCCSLRGSMFFFFFLSRDRLERERETDREGSGERRTDREKVRVCVYVGEGDRGRQIQREGRWRKQLVFRDVWQGDQLLCTH